MERQILNEEDAAFKKIKEEWFQQARKIETPEELAEFARHLLDDYVHDYGTVVRAVSAIALAGAWLGANKEGITGFQAGFVMWDFVGNWSYPDNKIGLRIIDYDNILYPQYEGYFNDKIISPERWEAIQELAKEKLKGLDDGYAACEVEKHWRSIANGVVPFGFRVKGDE